MDPFCSKDEDGAGPNIEIEDGIDLRNLTSGVEFTLKVPINFEHFEDDIDSAISLHNSFLEEFMVVNDVTQPIAMNEVKLKMKPITEDEKIKKFILRQGTGPCPKDVRVALHYIAYVEDSDAPFDSSYSRGLKPEIYRLGYGTVYIGFEMAVKSMKQDELACFYIHPDLAFKNLGVPPRIPPNASIFLQIDLVHIGEPKEVQNIDNITDGRSISDVYNKVKAYINKGNEYFRNSFITKAIYSFRQAEKQLSYCRLNSDEEELKWKRLLIKAFVNLCVCYNHSSCQKYKLVCLIAREAFDTVPEQAFVHPRLIFQLGKAKLGLGNIKESKKWLLKALELVGEDVEISRLLDQIQKLEQCGVNTIEELLSFQRIE